MHDRAYVRTVVDPAKVFIPTEPKMGSEDREQSQREHDRMKT